jgi:opacity protein-like surface antigen
MQNSRIFATERSLLLLSLEQRNMRRITLLFITIMILSLASASSFAQSSRFYYGLPAENTGLTIGVDVGMITRNLLSYTNDFEEEFFDIGYGISLNKTLSKRLSAEAVIRTGADLYGISHYTTTPIVDFYVIKKSIDLSLALVYEVPLSERLSLYPSLGAGVVNYKVSYSGIQPKVTNKTASEVVVPASLSMRYAISPKIQLGLGYRYYQTFTDEMDGFIYKGNDSYSYVYGGLYYKLNMGGGGRGSNGSRSCPMVD